MKLHLTRIAAALAGAEGAPSSSLSAPAPPLAAIVSKHPLAAFARAVGLRAAA